MDRMVARENKNKSDVRDERYAAYNGGRQAYRDHDTICPHCDEYLQEEWAYGWMTEQDKDD